MSVMAKVDTQELLTPPVAARARGVSRQWIDSLIRRGKIESVQVGGKRFVRLSDVLNYKPTDKGGGDWRARAGRKKGGKR